MARSLGRGMVTKGSKFSGGWSPLDGAGKNGEV